MKMLTEKIRKDPSYGGCVAACTTASRAADDTRRSRSQRPTGTKATTRVQRSASSSGPRRDCRAAQVPIARSRLRAAASHELKARVFDVRVHGRS